MQIQRLLNLAAQSASKNSTTILSGAAVIGVIATAALAVKATPKACESLAEAQEQKDFDFHGIADNPENVEIRHIRLAHIEVVKATWKFYIPAGIVGCCTIACIIGSNQIGLRRNAAMLGAYTLVDTAFREYKEEVVKQIGENKNNKIEEQVLQDRMERNPIASSQVIVTGDGEQDCYDPITDRYFRSSVERIRASANEINRRILSGGEMYVDHDQFYHLLGVPGCSAGEILGWNIDNLLELDFVGQLSECDKPVIAIRYKRYPREHYDKF
jgi:hypothetical protein